MDNAGLMLRLGKYGFNGLRHTLEAVCDGDQDVLYATVFNSVNTDVQKAAPSFS